jgi:hypothetical protein
VPVRRDLEVRVTPRGRPDLERLRELGERHAIESPVTRMVAVLS